MVGQFVSIVDNGTVLIEENGTLILTEVTGIDGGSGSGHFLSPDPDIPPTFQVLPPLPADVERVDFTWFSYVTVSLFLPLVLVNSLSLSVCTEYYSVMPYYDNNSVVGNIYFCLEKYEHNNHCSYGKFTNSSLT